MSDTVYYIRLVSLHSGVDIVNGYIKRKEWDCVFDKGLNELCKGEHIYVLPYYKDKEMKTGVSVVSWNSENENAVWVVSEVK